ncbi:MAG: CTP synthase [Anaerolineae bacterium]|nr:CTP synthase [Anaerolineae bacterium]MDX9830118.1 CTP synthase [Anaerolineae bacterium]
MTTKYIFCTGGVVSSVGKGVTAASVGRILRSRGVKVSIQKLDPYLNVDPGTMSPYQHGEVFVLDDGSETDLDLGHYERFIDENLGQASNVTSGQVYAEVIAKERRGDYLGGTIQVIPQVTNEMKRRIGLVGRKSGAEVVIVEVGGTVGDIEGLPFLEAIRQMRVDVGRENTVYIHVTLLPYISSTGEIKTKPTQHSVRELRGIGIQPDIIVARSDYPVDESVRAKIALFCDVEKRAVISLVTTPIIYEVPLILEEASLGDYLVERLGLNAHPPQLDSWRAVVEDIRRPKPPVRVGLVGKYVELHDAYLSVREALHHAGLPHGASVEIEWIDSETLERHGGESLEGLDGIVVPGGFGYRGIEGKIVAARFARENRVPYLGLCLGMQVMVIELARHAVGSEEPNSTEFDIKTAYPVIDLMADQRDISEMGGTMRLGLYPCQLMPGTRAAAAYEGFVQPDAAGRMIIQERHRHRWEVNNAYRDLLTRAGMVFSGMSPDGRLVEIGELADHPFMVGSQFHPEFKSRPTRPHPMFQAFVRATLDYQASRRAVPEVVTAEVNASDET